MSIHESPLFIDLLKKLVTEMNRATTDASASVESSPIRDILAVVEKMDFKNLDLSKLAGVLLKDSLGSSGLGGMLGSLGQAFGLGGPSAEETKADYQSAMSEVAAAGKSLQELDVGTLSPERSRLVGILGKIVELVQAKV